MTNQCPTGVFPTKQHLCATREVRTNALHACVDRGWVEVVANSWLKDSRFRQLHVSSSECRFEDDAFLCKNNGVLTLSGHEKWEADFQPDWGRFWMQLVDCDEEANRRLRIAYASDAIHDDLIEWLPYYWSLDEKIGLVELACDTECHYRATKWKILPYVKVIEWQGQSRASNFELSEDMQASELIERASKFLEHTRVYNECFYRSIQVLHRLSKKWDCTETSEPVHLSLAEA
jgi:hypothetical protein